MPTLKHWVPLLNKVKKVSSNTELMENGSMNLMLSEVLLSMRTFTIMTKKTIITLLVFFQRTEQNGQLLTQHAFCSN